MADLKKSVINNRLQVPKSHKNLSKEVTKNYSNNLWQYERRCFSWKNEICFLKDMRSP